MHNRDRDRDPGRGLNHAPDLHAPAQLRIWFGSASQLYCQCQCLLQNPHFNCRVPLGPGPGHASGPRPSDAPGAQEPELELELEKAVKPASSGPELCRSLWAGQLDFGFVAMVNFFSI